MYIPASNAEHRPEVMLDFIEAHPLGALVTASDIGLFATHLPLLVDRTRGPMGTLEGHVARANPHHRRDVLRAEGLVIFTGADAYVSPGLYPSKARDGKVVPTWNYVAVHAYGLVRFLDDATFLERHLERLTSRHESTRDAPWAVSDAPADYIEKLVRSIVGVEIELTRLEGKWKMSQNRPTDDIDGVVHGLSGASEPKSREVAEIVAARRPRPAAG